MKAVGRFEKVSLAQFTEAINELFKSHGGEVSNEDLVRYAYDGLTLPERATTGSAGYDFESPISFTLKPGESIKIPTGIRAIIEDGWFLMCVPRSGLGFKYQIRFANTLPIVDSDYYGSSNEGHIFLKFVNGGNRNIVISSGDAVAQGIFLPYGITYSDDATGVRDGGFGSTGK